MDKGFCTISTYSMCQVSSLQNFHSCLLCKGNQGKNVQIAIVMKECSQLIKSLICRSCTRNSSFCHSWS